jgi:hypothetical protein
MDHGGTVPEKQTFAPRVRQSAGMQQQPAASAIQYHLGGGCDH